MSMHPPDSPLDATQTIEPSESSLKSPRPWMGRVLGLWSRGSRAVAALVDQAVASGGNFALQLMVRWYFASELGTFGLFVLVFDAILFINTLQAALVTYPLTVRGAASDESKLGRLATVSLIFTLVLAVPIGVGSIVVGAMFGHELIALAALSAMVMWQFQETLRRAIMAHLRHHAAIAGDAVAYLGMAAGVFVLYRTDLLTLAGAFGMMGLGFAAGAITHAMMLKPRRLERGDLRQAVGDFWGLGRWILLINFTGIISTLSYGWTLAWLWGTDAVGVLGSYALLLKLTNPLMSSMASLIVPVTARRYASEGLGGALRGATKYALFGAALLAPYYGLILIAPTTAVKLLGNGDFPGSMGALRVFVFGYILLYVLTMTAAFFNGLGKSRTTFIGHMAGVISSVILGLPLTALYGVSGAVVGGMVVTLIQLLAMLILLSRMRAMEPPRS